MLSKQMGFSEITSGDMVITYEGDVLEVGTPVFTYDENGEKIVLENGDYETEIGTIKVIDGIVKEIVEPVTEEEEPVEPITEAPVEQSTEPIEQAIEPNEMETRIVELETKINTILELLNKTVDMNSEFSKQIEELKNESTDININKKIGKSISNEFNMDVNTNGKASDFLKAFQDSKKK